METKPNSSSFSTWLFLSTNKHPTTTWYQLVYCRDTTKKYMACCFHQEINFMGKHGHLNYQLHTKQIVHPSPSSCSSSPIIYTRVHLASRAPSHDMDHCSPASQGIQHTNSAALKHFVTTTGWLGFITQFYMRQNKKITCFPGLPSHWWACSHLFV